MWRPAGRPARLGTTVAAEPIQIWGDLRSAVSTTSGERLACNLQWLQRVRPPRLEEQQLGHADAAGHGDLLPQPPQDDCRIQGVAAWKDGDSLAERQLTGLRKSSNGTRKDIGNQITDAEYVQRLSWRVHDC